MTKAEALVVAGFAMLMVGEFLLRHILPKHSAITFGGRSLEPTDRIGTLAKVGGLTLFWLGVSCQAAGVLLISLK